MMGARERVRGEWVRRLARFRATGLSVAGFCRREGVSVAAFYQWRKKLGRPHEPGLAVVHGTRRAGAVSFVPVSVGAASGAGLVEIVLPGGAMVRVSGGDLAVVEAAVRAAAWRTGSGEAAR
jgi:hypothetical protein